MTNAAPFKHEQEYLHSSEANRPRVPIYMKKECFCVQDKLKTNIVKVISVTRLDYLPPS